MGIYTYGYDLVKALAQIYDVHVLTEIDGTYKRGNLDGQVTFHNIGKSVLNPVKAFAYIRKLKKIMKIIQPDLCMTFTIRPTIYGNLAARKLKVPVISSITGTGPLFESNSISYFLARKLYRYVLKKSSLVVFPNMDDLGEFVKRKYVTSARAILIPGSGINVEHFSPLPSGEKQDGKFSFLFVSRLIKDKGTLEYVEAAALLKARYPGAEFHIVGPLWEGNKKSLTVTKEELNGWIDKNLVVYHGKQNDVRPYIANADCVVIPSYREGLNNVLQEGAAMEKPLITTNVTGCRDVVEDGVNGLLCQVKSGTDLALKMEQMMNFSAAQREEMGKRGREKMIREFDKKIVIQKYLEAIKEILDGKR